MPSPRKISMLSIILFLLLLGSTSFLLWRVQNEKEIRGTQNEQNAQVVANLTNDLLVISQDLDAKIAETRRLGGRVEILEEIKADLEKEIENLYERNTISLIKITNLSNQIRDYEATIASKEREISALVNSTREMAQEKRELEQVLDSLEQSVEDYEASQRILAEKAGLAGRLKTLQIRLIGVNRRGVENEDLRVRQIEKLKAKVTISENFAALPGEKDLFLTLVDPSGQPVITGSASSKYIAKLRFQYELEEIQLEFELSDLPPLRAGDYLLRVSGTDYIMGERVFSIK
jgi:DNA repair exonuclease SbcCD ATPase subunit